MRFRLGRLALLLGGLATVAGSGCMQQRAAINRVQPDYLDKRDLIPVEYDMLVANTATPDSQLSAEILSREPAFYTQTTLIHKPATTGFVGVTEYSEATKVRWEVTENYLVARRSFDYIHNQPSSSIGGNPQVGDVVAVFRIESHFDIRRAYNTTTGEEMNVIEENSTDRPWYQRRFMRVDWSQNLITGFNSVLQYDEWTGRVQAEPVPVFVNNPQDPNAPVFEYSGDNENRKLEYFDIVNRAVLHPETMSFGPDYPNVPVCILTSNAEDCAPSEVSFRMAFRRVDPRRDYEPASLTVPLDPTNTNNPPTANLAGHYLDMERFGFFDVQDIGYDDTFRTVLNSRRQRYASRHNMWLHHHLLNFPSGQAGTACNHDADCTGEGEICHMFNDGVNGSRGVCQVPAINHAGDTVNINGTDVAMLAAPEGLPEPACTTDDDCLQSFGSHTGLSNYAVCDTTRPSADGVHPGTCGERYFRCQTDDICKQIDAAYQGIDPSKSTAMCDVTIAYNRLDNRGLCTMPFRQREVRQISYHETPGYPSYMQPVTESIVHEWNSAFVDAVRSARRHECELARGINPADTALSADPCDDPSVTHIADPATDPTADAHNVFVGCHSPVWGVDPALPGAHTQEEVDATHASGFDLAACGPQGTMARLGDMRYSSIGAITEYDKQGYWGLANIASDPESGEMVVGRGAVWQQVTDSIANYMIQLMRVLHGDVEPDQIADGSYIAESMRQLGTGQQTPAGQALDNPIRQGLMRDTILNGRAGLDRLAMQGAGWFRPESGMTMFDQRDARGNVVREGAQTSVLRRLRDGRILGDGVPTGANRLRAMRGTPFESMLMNEQQALLAPTASPDPTAQQPMTLEFASPLRGQSPEFRRFLQRMRTQLQAWECGYEASSFDDIIWGIAQRLLGVGSLGANDPNEITFGRDWNFKNPDGSLDYNTLQTYVAQFIHHGVLAHELGHSLGQRHNFTASADAINYQDHYWEVRGKGHPAGIRPRYEYLADPNDGQYESQEELDGRVEEFTYSSVMDYKGLNEDAHGIGRYDYQFIKNGYVGMVEAFRHVADRNGALTYSANVAGNGFSSPLDLRDYGRGIVRGLHYSQIPQFFGSKTVNGTSVPDIGDDNRYTVFLSETNTESVVGFGSPNFSNVTNDGHVLVPYRFDSDDRAGLIWQDQRYDQGADSFESLHYVAERWLNYYFANSYARGRVGFSTDQYVSRMWGRYLDQLHQTAQMQYFDMVAYQDYFKDLPGWNAYVTDPTLFGIGHNMMALSMATDAFASMITMPEMGYHLPQTLADDTTYITPTQLGSGIQIPINDGRAFESNYRYAAGYFWFDEFNRVGAYYDKVLSLFQLVTPELYLIGRDTPTDIRLFQLNWFTMFPDQMTRFFGGVLSEDYADFAPIVHTTGDREILRPHIATLNLPQGTGPGTNGRVLDATHQALDPQDHFTLQVWSALMTMSQFPATYDQRYMDYARLWQDGTTEAVETPNPAQDTVSFTDPWSHVTFRALHFDTAPGGAGQTIGASALHHPSLNGNVANEAGVAARMILHVNDMDAVRRAAIARNDMARAQEVEMAEHKYIDLLNTMRLFTQYMSHGYLGGDF